MAVQEYQNFIHEYPQSHFKGEGNQMIAQAFERLGKNGEAENWYRQMMKDTSQAVRHEAEEHIAQAIYLQGDTLEKTGNFQKAELAYARVTDEFPKSSLASISLFNAGVMAERTKAWPRAIKYYNQFFDLFYTSQQLVRVLFREAKCRELNGEFFLAGEKFMNIAKTYPQSKEAEPSLYSAGFAFVSADSLYHAARTFVEYAKTFPNLPEAPNLLSRAMETYGALKQWEKVTELQSDFSRRYGGSKSRLVQSLSMSALSHFQQGDLIESRKLFQQAIDEYVKMKDPDAPARYYAAQAYCQLGDFEREEMRALPLRKEFLKTDLKSKQMKLGKSAEHYLVSMELKIVDWVIRSGYGLGELFKNYGDEYSQSMLAHGSSVQEELVSQENALTEIISAYKKSINQYFRVLQIAQKQNVNNQSVEAARSRIHSLFAVIQNRMEVLDTALLAAFPDPGTGLEAALSKRLDKAQRAYEFHQDGLEWFAVFFEQIPAKLLDSTKRDSLGDWVLNRFLIAGNRFSEVVEATRSAPIPTGYDSIQTFFYLSKLIQELTPSIDNRVNEIFSGGLDFASRHKLSHLSRAQELRNRLGEALYSKSFCLAFLAKQALNQPPIPIEMIPAQKALYEKKFEEVGYVLQDLATQAERALVESAVKEQASYPWASRGFAALLIKQPDRWQMKGSDGEPEAQWRFPWNKEIVSDAALDSLRVLPFSSGHFSH